MSKFLSKLKRLYYFNKNNYVINRHYQKWIKINEPAAQELNEQKNHKFDYMPKISVVIPTYNPNLNYFKILIDSILGQTYSNFEVCIADGSEKENEELKAFLTDERIKYNFLNKNGGISENTNEAIKMATGDFILFADHDDKLPLFCMYEVVKKINENKDVDFIYSDEDIIIENKRCNPHFKPDFSIDTLRSYNYICHLSVVRKTILDEIGYLNKEFDGAQDYDMILRIAEKTKSIVHIPKILYHWRSHRASTSTKASSKSYAFENGAKAIKAHLERMKLDAEVSMLNEPGRYRVKYLIKNRDLVSILIPNKDSVEDLDKCINSVLLSSYENFEIIVIENNSKEKETFEYYEKIEKNPKIKVVKYETSVFNFSKINNYGVKFAKGKYLLFLNNDTEVINDTWLGEMVAIAGRDEVGIVGAKLLYFDSTVQHAGVIIGMGGVAGHIHKGIEDSDAGYFSRASVINNFSAVTAACLLTKKEIFDKVGGFEEEGLAVAFNDVDFCMKVRALGYLCVYTPQAKLYHYESKSRGLENTKEKKERFAKEIQFFKEKWKKELEKGDPYFNKNLRLDTAKFMVEDRKKIDYER